MPFTSNHAIMEHFCAKLSGIAKATPSQCLVRNTLPHICSQSQLFDRYVSTDSPFFHEFFDALRLGRVADDQCFSILECLIIFCRERALRCQTQAISAEERSLLKHFESSGAWEDATGQTLIAEWYWKILPKRHILSKTL